MPPLAAHHQRPSARREAGRDGAFTLIELLAVIAIIAVIAAITIPAVRMLGKSNDQSQASNLVRSMISNARSIAISQRRMAGIVFFEETSNFSQPVHGNQTAMQIFVEAFDQSGVATPWPLPAQAPLPGCIKFVYHSTARQYLPEGVRLASLTDLAGNVETGDAASGTRVILFDAEGELVLQAGLWAPPPSGARGTYPQAFGDWKFDGSANARSYPGFFLYSKSEYFAQPAANRLTWLKRNSSVILVNANTGSITVTGGNK